MSTDPMTALHTIDVSGVVYVELEESENIVIGQRHLDNDPDTRITITNVGALINGLRECLTIRDIQEGRPLHR